MRIEWQKFDWVEVQVFKPETPAKSAILFCPGFPGAGATVFEQRHAGALTDAGYAVYVIHHKGTKLDCGFTPMMVNNSNRLQDAYSNGEKHLGGGKATISDWMIEPKIVLQDIVNAYDDVKVIGNSYGAISALWSLTEDDVSCDKVSSLLLYAGAQATFECVQQQSVMRYWTEDAPTLPHVIQKIEFDTTQPFASVLHDVYKALPERVMEKLPAHVRLTYLVVEKDEIIPLSDTENFKAAIGGRGEIVIDRVDHAWPEAGIMAHDTPNFRTSDLIGLIAG
jgi:pimeloyl-ACP methyl ester carboxylesterase